MKMIFIGSNLLHLLNPIYIYIYALVSLHFDVLIFIIPS